MPEMIAPESPPGFVVRTEAQKAAWDNGYRIDRGVDGGWLHCASTTAPGAVWIAGASPHGPWLLSIDHSGVAAELGAHQALARHRARPRHLRSPHLEPAPCGARSHLQACRQPARRPTHAFSHQDKRPAADHRSRASGGPARRAGYLPRGPYGLLGRPLPADRDYRAGAAARLAHRAVGRLRSPLAHGGSPRN
jgi:hypothetical protein